VGFLLFSLKDINAYKEKWFWSCMVTKADVDDDKVIGLIQKTNSHYTLNSYQIDKLRDAGVSERVINYMMYNT